MNINIKLLEDSLTVLWAFTATKQGCIGLVDSLHDVQQLYPSNSDEHKLINDCRDLAFTKGQIMAAAENVERRKQSGMTAVDQVINAIVHTQRGSHENN